MGQSLQAILLNLLQQKAQGVSEYRLLKQLQHLGHPRFINLDFKDSHNLYQAHFLLFHNLYLLRERLRESAQQVLAAKLPPVSFPVDVEISPLKIALYYSHAPMVTKQQQAEFKGKVVETDRQAAYYLDIQNLNRFSAAAAETLLQQGYARLERLIEGQIPEVEQALTKLNCLTDYRTPFSAADWQQIRYAYHIAIAKHHPDRGGDAQQAQEINQAYQLLEEYRELI